MYDNEYEADFSEECHSANKGSSNHRPIHIITGEQDPRIPLNALELKSKISSIVSRLQTNIFNIK